ncbi:KPN_02809 family neutral zinc metallopeptidase [Wenxinia saemankumensis]|uniref:Neutral zinc metallopeptidase n=1 Tax=Wenxinia saemankumensis TaxID=1447782 RepID=A0A1M6A262_9RHOB|nr:neutral zinc metallopeptidase [Wenxinia saemankumensis]SHI30409.1 hypothetical protein SAMN05444417_0160 [Wenxinia saemankumensis]
MKWRGRRGSSNIEDRRGAPGGGAFRVPRGRITRRGGGGGAAVGGLGGLGLVAVLVIGWALGIDVTGLLDEGGGQVAAPREVTQADRAAGDFVSVVLADTEEVWTTIFAEQLGADYSEPTLVLFSGSTRSPCGQASAATGPFYCPADGKVYLDTDFFAVLQNQLGAQGDFAAAYVVAHEVGHYVQDVLGTLGEANALRQQVGQARSNEISVRIELQADCYSGIWARYAEADLGVLDPGDIDEALNAAARIGDDALQRQSGGVVRPETFTHGTSEQRRGWFDRGYASGELAACDTGL